MFFSSGHPHLVYHSTQGSCSLADGSFISQAGWVRGWLWLGVSSSGVSPAACPRRDHVVQDGKWKTPPRTASKGVQAGFWPSHEPLMNSFHLPPSCTCYQYFTSHLLHQFSLPSRLAAKPGQVIWRICLRAECFACRQELNSSLSWKVRDHHRISCLLQPLLGGPFPEGGLQPKMSESSWHRFSGWLLKPHTCIRKQKINNSVASSGTHRRAWDSWLDCKPVLWNSCCLVKNIGWLQFVMLIEKSHGIGVDFSKHIPLVLAQFSGRSLGWNQTAVTHLVWVAHWYRIH